MYLLTFYRWTFLVLLSLIKSSIAQRKEMAIIVQSLYPAGSLVNIAGSVMAALVF